MVSQVSLAVEGEEASSIASIAGGLQRFGAHVCLLEEEKVISFGPNPVLYFAPKVGDVGKGEM